MSEERNGSTDPREAAIKMDEARRRVEAESEKLQEALERARQEKLDSLENARRENR
jgi:hypothetical protein